MFKGNSKKKNKSFYDDYEGYDSYSGYGSYGGGSSLGFNYGGGFGVMRQTFKPDDALITPYVSNFNYIDIKNIGNMLTSFKDICTLIDTYVKGKYSSLSYFFDRIKNQELAQKYAKLTDTINVLQNRHDQMKKAYTLIGSVANQDLDYQKLYMEVMNNYYHNDYIHDIYQMYYEKEFEFSEDVNLNARHKMFMNNYGYIYNETIKMLRIVGRWSETMKITKEICSMLALTVMEYCIEKYKKHILSFIKFLHEMHKKDQTPNYQTIYQQAMTLYNDDRYHDAVSHMLQNSTTQQQQSSCSNAASSFNQSQGDLESQIDQANKSDQIQEYQQEITNDLTKNMEMSNNANKDEMKANEEIIDNLNIDFNAIFNEANNVSDIQKILNEMGIALTQQEKESMEKAGMLEAIGIAAGKVSQMVMGNGKLLDFMFINESIKDEIKKFSKNIAGAFGDFTQGEEKVKISSFLDNPDIDRTIEIETLAMHDPELFIDDINVKERRRQPTISVYTDISGSMTSQLGGKSKISGRCYLAASIINILTSAKMLDNTYLFDTRVLQIKNKLNYLVQVLRANGGGTSIDTVVEHSKKTGPNHYSMILTDADDCISKYSENVFIVCICNHPPHFSDRGTMNSYIKGKQIYIYDAGKNEFRFLTDKDV